MAKVSFVSMRTRSGRRVSNRKRMAKGRARKATRNPITRGMPKRKVDYARVVEAQELPIIVGAGGTYALNYTTQLSEYNRAQEVAHAYKYYRCAKVELSFVPYANFATTNGPANSRLPQLYFSVDRVASMWQTPTEAEMNERGILPKIFTRRMDFAWKPNLLQHVQLETASSLDNTIEGAKQWVTNAINSVPLFNKWLPTQQGFGFKAPGGNPPNQTGIQVVQPASNPYALKYYGAVAVIDIEGAEGGQQVGDLFVKTTWEFKGPRVIKATGQANPEPYESAATSIINPGSFQPNQQPSVYP